MKNYFKHLLINFIFPKRKDKKSLIVSFIGVPGVGKSFIAHKLRLHNISPCRLGANSAKKIANHLNISISQKHKKIIDFFQNNYPKLSRTQLLAEIYSRSINRNIYVDESILNRYPTNVLKDFYKKEPKLFKDFFKSTLVICVEDTPENILKKVNNRITKGKEHAGYKANSDKENLQKITKSVKEFKDKIKFLKTCTNIFEIQAQLPLHQKIKICKKKIKEFDKQISSNITS